MKKSKSTIVLYILYCIVCLAIASGIIGCCIVNDSNPFKFGNSSDYGTYYKVIGNSVDENVFFTLEKGNFFEKFNGEGTWKDENGFSGKCEISNGKITLYADSRGEMILASGSIGNGEMELKLSEYSKVKFVKQ